jgi:HTH-type transcriptional regulator / antitoxin MqsA
MMAKPERNCPACGEGHLHMRTYSLPVEHRGTAGEIRQHKWQCDHCKADLFDDACGKQNKRAWIRFQKEVEGVPTGEQIRTLRRALGLSSEMAGALLGGGPKAFSKYENEEIVPRGAMRTLVRYLLKYPGRIDEILEANGHGPREKPAAATPVSGRFRYPHAKPAHREPATACTSLASATFAALELFAQSSGVEPEGIHVANFLEGVAWRGKVPDLVSVLPYPFYATHPAVEVDVASEDQVIGNWAANRGARA